MPDTQTHWLDNTKASKIKSLTDDELSAAIHADNKISAAHSAYDLGNIVVKHYAPLLADEAYREANLANKARAAGIPITAYYETREIKTGIVNLIERIHIPSTYTKDQLRRAKELLKPVLRRIETIGIQPADHRVLWTSTHNFVYYAETDAIMLYDAGAWKET